VGYILRDFGVNPAQSSSEMHKQLGEVLVRETEAGRKCVVVIDEAQNLSDAVLERVRLITNFETSQGKLLQIIFSGQPQLTNKLMQESLIQLRQRVSTFCRLELLTEQETAEYIDFRLKQAGYGGESLFTEDALKLIAETSKGTPRTINNLCFNTLALCCTMQSKQVDGSMVAKIAANLQLVSKAGGSIETISGSADEQPSVRKLWKQFRQMLTLWGQTADNRMKLWVPATAAVLLLSALGVLKLSGIADTQPRNVDNERPLSTNVPTEPVHTPTAVKPRKTLPAKATPNSKAVPNPRPFEMGMAAGRLSASSLAAAKMSAPPSQSNGAGAANQAQALLSINCIPTGADIEIDGAFVGDTPSTVSVVLGTHQITVKKSGYTGWTKTLRVTGGTIQLNAELIPELPKQ
jgi:hypothetical protein